MKLLSSSRRHFATFAAASLLATSVLAQTTLLTHHTRPVVTEGHVAMTNLLPETKRLSLTISMPLKNEASLDAFIKSVSDPGSQNYRKYLTVNEFTEKFAPTVDEYKAVSQFLESNGLTVTETSPNRLIINVDGKVSDINRIFQLQLRVYQHPTEPRTFFAPDREPTVNHDIKIWHVGGLDTYATPKPMYKRAERGSLSSEATGSGPNGNFLGSDRRAAYYGGTQLTGYGQTIGLFELDGYNMADVSTYFRNVNQPINASVTNVLVLGASAGSDGDDTEQAIDIIEALSMSPSSPVRVYIAPRSSFSSGKNDTNIFNKMATENITNQVSVSWLWSPADASSNDPIFKQMAAQGQTLFVASGDHGSFDSSELTYPAEDQYVTAVGGTALTTNGPGGSWTSETTWSGSGGGISSKISIPNYQKISGVISPSNKGSQSQRNVPDVSAEADYDNYYCANGVCGGGLGGTSLAAPTWAGFMALVNQQAASNSQGATGFLNPTIYDQFGTGPGYLTYLHDITSGNNGAYAAVGGYDLATGWGSPKPALVSALAVGSGQCSYAGPGRALLSGKTLTSCDGRFTLTMQSSDGNLVLYWNGQGALWATGTQSPGAFAAMQVDGNFVVYSNQRQVLWSTSTQGRPGSYLELQNDGNLVVYDPGRVPLWSSKTCCH